MKPPRNHSHLWNNLPTKERERLYPMMVEAQYLHIWQCKEKAIKAHKFHMKMLDSQMRNIADELNGMIETVD